MPDSRLTIVAETQGTSQAAADLQKVADAQQRLLAGQGGSRAGPATEAELLAVAEMQLREATSEVADAQENLISKQDKYIAVHRNYLGLLRQINPTIAYYAEGMIRSVRVAGDLATKHLELNDILKAGKGFITENANGLALLGAGGAVIAGISAISAAVRQMQKDFEAATKSIEENNKALTDLKRKEGEGQQRIEEIAATRKEGGFGSPDAARAAGQQARRVEEKFRGVVSPEEIEKAAGFLGDKSVTDEELARVAFSLKRPGSLELDPHVREASRQRAIERASRRDREAFDKQVALERGQAKETRDEAEKQARTTMGSQEALEDTTRADLGIGATDKDVEELAKLRRMFPTREDFMRGYRLAQRHTQVLREPIDTFLRNFSNDIAAVPPEEEADTIADAITVTPEQFAKLGRLWTAGGERNTGRNVTISAPTYNQQNWKNIVPGQRAREEASMNGAARARLAEE